MCTFIHVYQHLLGQRLKLATSAAPSFGQYFKNNDFTSVAERSADVADVHLIAVDKQHEVEKKITLYGNISSVTGEIGTVPHTGRELMCLFGGQSTNEIPSRQF